jgi:hypothetical protein
MEWLKTALGGDPERGVPPVSIPAYLVACAVGVFVGTLCYMGMGLVAPLGAATLPKGPALLEHLPQMVGGFLFMAATVSILLVVPVAIVAAPIVLPLLIRLKPRGLLPWWAAAGLGAAAGIAAVVLPLLVVAAIDADPALARISPAAGMLAAPSGALAGLTYRVLVARSLLAARPM